MSEDGHDSYSRELEDRVQFLNDTAKLNAIHLYLLNKFQSMEDGDDEAFIAECMKAVGKILHLPDDKRQSGVEMAENIQRKLQEETFPKVQEELTKLRAYLLESDISL